jgi:hypothetical protein
MTEKNAVAGVYAINQYVVQRKAEQTENVSVSD